MSDERWGAEPVEVDPDLHEIFGMNPNDPAVVVAAADSTSGGARDEQLRAAAAGDSEGPGTAPGAPRTGITSPTRRGSSSRFLTDVIVEMGLVARERVDEAIETSRSSGTTPEKVLVEEGVLSHDGLARALAERYGLDHLDLGVFQVDMSAANLVTTAAAKRYQAVPVAFVDKRTLLVAMTDPSNVLAVDDIAIMTGYEVRVAVAAAEDIVALISRLDRLEDVVAESGVLGEGEAEQQTSEIVDLHETADDAPGHQARQPDRRAGGRSSTPPTCTSPRTAGRCGCASASTACCRTSRPCRGGWPPEWSRA